MDAGLLRFFLETIHSGSSQTSPFCSSQNKITQFSFLYWIRFVCITTHSLHQFMDHYRCTSCAKFMVFWSAHMHLGERIWYRYWIWTERYIGRQRNMNLTFSAYKIPTDHGSYLMNESMESVCEHKIRHSTYRAISWRRKDHAPQVLNETLELYFSISFFSWRKVLKWSAAL